MKDEKAGYANGNLDGGRMFSSSFIPDPSFLFRRRLYVHIDLLCSTTSEDAIPVKEQQAQHEDYKDRDDCDYTRTSPTTTAIVVGHDVAPSRFRFGSGGNHC